MAGVLTPFSQGHLCGRDKGNRTRKLARALATCLCRDLCRNLGVPGPFVLTSACSAGHGEISGDAVVTIELEKCTQLVQTSARMKRAISTRMSWVCPTSSKPMQSNANCQKRRFHGGNTGSNPVGDANKSMTYEDARDGVLNHAALRLEK